jgi:methyl-accepting chemotaxis protein
MFQHLRLAERLAFGFGIVIALMAVTLAFILFETRQAQQHIDALVVEQSERLALAREWKENIAVNSQRAIAIGLSSDDSLSRHFAEGMQAVTTRTTALQKRFAEIETTPEGREHQDRLADVRKRYLAQREALLKARGDPARLAAEGEAFKRLAAEYIGVADGVVAHQLRREAQQAKQIGDGMARLRQVAVGRDPGLRGAGGAAGLAPGAQRHAAAAGAAADGAARGAPPPTMDEINAPAAASPTSSASSTASRSRPTSSR